MPSAGAVHELVLAPLAVEHADRYRPPRPGEPLVFAIPHYVSLTPWNSGAWHEEEGKGRVWSLRIRAPGALSLNFGFGKFRLPRGASMVVRDLEGSARLGPFTEKHNRNHGQLWTPLLPGGEAQVELMVPRGMLHHVELELTAINLGFRGLPLGQGLVHGAGAFSQKSAQPGDCNVDVACPEAAPWADEVRSVALLTIQGREVCSGTLLNNTSQDLTPYFLTADHCGITPANAQSVVVYWNYEKSSCGGPPDGLRDQFTQGAYFRAGWSAAEGSDFTLLELSQKPEPSFYPHWAGWDRRDLLPQGAVAIHHPQGAEKRISFDEDPLTLAEASDGLPVGSPLRYLKVGAWDLGTTEAGSSGCGLWNTEHRLVGQLWGGTASCGFPQGPDYFGRLRASWEGAGSSTTGLKDHLDPLATGQETLDGRDGCIPPQVDFLASPNPAAVGEPVIFTSEVSSGEPPYTYFWDLDGDGFQDCDLPQCVFSYSQPYEGNVRLMVQDSQPCQASVTGSMLVVDPEQGVRLVSPGQGDVVPSGGVFLARWFAPQRAVGFKLLYSMDGGKRWHLITDQATGRQYEWPVPIVRENKRRSLLKIIGYDSDGRKVGSDRSDGFFTTAVVQLATIKGGEVLRSGESYPVSWVTNQTIAPVQKVKILFSMNGKLTWKKIAALEGNPGSFTMTVPTVTKRKENCWIKVLLLDARGESIGSDATDQPFTVTP